MKSFKHLYIIAALAAAFITGCGGDNTQEAARVQEQQTEAATEAVTEAAEQAAVVGNTPSNFINGGICASAGDKVYYMGKEDGKKGLYLINNSTGVTELIAEVSAADLTVYEGMVYYLSGGSIYKAGARLAPEAVKEDGAITNMCAGPDRIYYIKKDNNGLGKIYKLLYSGTGETMVNPKSDPTADILSITFANGRLYFTDNSGVGCINTDGSGKTYLLTGYQISDYGVYGDYLYFVYNGGLFRIKQGGGSEAVECGAANIQRINIAGDRIYLVYDGGIGYVSAAGGEVTQISGERPTAIGAGGSYVFGSKGMFFYRMKPDGSEAVAN